MMSNEDHAVGYYWLHHLYLMYTIYVIYCLNTSECVCCIVANRLWEGDDIIVGFGERSTHQELPLQYQWLSSGTLLYHIAGLIKYYLYNFAITFLILQLMSVWMSKSIYQWDIMVGFDFLSWFSLHIVVTHTRTHAMIFMLKVIFT